jgi:hypothetical protein
VDAAKLDIFGFDVFGLCVEGVLLPRIWWIEENSKLAARRMPLNILLINYQSMLIISTSPKLPI